MNWPGIILENRWQKLFALGLAVLIWFTVRSTDGLKIREHSADITLTFSRVSITVLTSAADLGRYAVTPDTMSVELRGDPAILQQLTALEIEAYVNLADLGATPQTLPIHVNPPRGTTLLSSQPAKVLVDRLPENHSPK